MNTVVGVGAAFAATGTGTFGCSKVGGLITFTPPLKNGGVSAETVKVKATATTCSGTANPKPTKVTATATIHSSNNSCAGLAGARPISVHLTYSPVVTASTLSGTANETISGQQVAFTFSGTVTGSYPSGSASGSGKIKQTLSQIGTACGSTAGLKSLTIAGGSLANG
jgi:hypothetical protein